MTRAVGDRIVILGEYTTTGSRTHHLLITVDQLTFIYMITTPKDYVDTFDSDNSLEFDISLDFEKTWNYYCYANLKDSKDDANIVEDYELHF